MKLLLHRKIHTGAYKLFMVFFVLFYIVPAVGLIVFYEEYRVSYNINGGFWPLLIVPATLFLVYIFDLVLPRIKNKTNWVGNLIFNDYILLLFASVFLLTSIYFYQNFSMSFRQKESISDGGVIIIVMFALRALFKVVIFHYLVNVMIGEKLTKIRRGIVYIVLISFSLTIMTSYDVVLLTSMLILVFNKEKIFKSFSSINIGKFVFSIVILLVTIILVIFVGIANKIGVDEALRLFSDRELIKFVILIVLKRLSTHFISIITAGNNYYNDLELIIKLSESQISNLINRFLILFGSNEEVNKPEIWSVNRLNYLRLFQDIDNEKTGSSPGVFASIFYFPNIIFGIIVTAIFIIWILRKVSDLVKVIKSNNFIGYFIFLFFIIPLFESPIDLINFLSPSFIYFFFFLHLPTK